MEAKTKSFSFLTESCGRAPKTTTFFDAAPNPLNNIDLLKELHFDWKGPLESRNWPHGVFGT